MNPDEPQITHSITDCNDCAVRWSCALEMDGPKFEPCPKHRVKEVCKTLSKGRGETS